MRTRRVALPDIEVEIAEAQPAAGGGRPLLLVHGFGGAKEDFTGHLDLLAALGWHAVAPDLRGHGASDKPVGPHAYSLDVFSSDVLALADALGWGPFTLLGHSMGGMIAQVAALAAPRRLAALILMDTSHACPDGLDPDVVEMARGVVAESGMAQLVELSKEYEDPLASPAYQQLCADRPGYRAWLDAKTLAVSPDMWLTMSAEMIRQPDRLDALASLPMPSLVICGEQDLGFLEHSRRMAKSIPNARLAVIPGAGHSPQFEAPDAWWQALWAFLASVGS